MGRCGGVQGCRGFRKLAGLQRGGGVDSCVDWAWEDQLGGSVAVQLCGDGGLRRW